METGREAHGIKSLNRHVLEQIVAASPAAMLVADASCPELPIVYANPAYERLTGFTLAELAGRAWSSRDAGSEPLAPPAAGLDQGAPFRVTISAARKDGTDFRCDVSATPLRGSRGDLRFLLLSYDPISEGVDEDAAGGVSDVERAGGEVSVLQREPGAKQKLATLDRIDPATGLVRFTYFQDTLRRDLKIARRERRFVTLLVFEIVEFDVYRQTFGDKAADSCQRMIGAQIMRALRRAGDLSARYADGTLVAAVIGQHASDVEPLVDRIADSVRQLKLHNPRAKTSRYIETRVTVIGCPPGAHDDPEPLIVRALTESRGTDVPARAVTG